MSPLASTRSVVVAWTLVLLGTMYLVARPVREPSIDFYTFYIGAASLHEGRPLYAAETHARIAEARGIRNADRYAYPATLAVALQPFLLLSPRTASLVWFLLNVGLLALTVRLLLRSCPIPDPRLRGLMLVLPVLFAPVIMNFYLGQSNILVLLLVTLAHAAFLRGRPYAAGAWLSVAAWIKVWPIVPVAYFVWKGQWRVVAGAMVAGVGVGVATALLAGGDQTVSFFTHQFQELNRGGSYGMIDHLNHSIRGLFMKMFDPASDWVVPLVRSPYLATWGTRAAAALLVAITVALCSRPIRLERAHQFSTEFMLVLVATMLITQRMWDASLTLLLLPYTLILARVARGDRDARTLAGVGLIAFVLIDAFRPIWAVGKASGRPVGWYLLTSPFVGLVLLWAGFAWARLREAHGVRSSVPSQRFRSHSGRSEGTTSGHPTQG